jgi:uncharacterized protein (DUF362 family)
MRRQSDANAGMTRRGALAMTLGGSAAGVGAGLLLTRRALTAETFIGKADSYRSDLAGLLLSGLRELGVTEGEVRGKRVLLKPNLVEVLEGAEHINTHPLLVRGAAEAFLRMGAATVTVAEGQGHVRDSLLVLEESGLADVLYEDRIPFVDLNNDSFFETQNLGNISRLGELVFPTTLGQADLVVSMAKMKTHHWAGVTLSMKNLFGVMPGIVYGWPKNRLHMAGLLESILDINATLAPGFAIVDGIVGMEGDGPIMGDARRAGVVVMGRNRAAVDATAARVMGVDPLKVPYLALANNWLGAVQDESIAQRGEAWRDMQTDFQLREDIEAQQGIRLES